jgi:tetratricopeptide (TPR) repeat protein
VGALLAASAHAAEPKTWKALSKDVAALLKEKKYEDAEVPAEEALELAQAEFGPEHLNVTKSLHALAQVRRGQGHIEEAETLFKKCIAMKIRLLGPEDVELAPPLENLAAMYRKQGMHAKALPFLLSAYDIKMKKYGLDDAFVAPTALQLGRVYREMKQYDDAELYYDHAQKILEAAAYPNLPELARIYEEMTEIYKATGRSLRVPELLEKARKAREEHKSRTGKPVDGPADAKLAPASEAGA